MLLVKKSICEACTELRIYFNAFFVCFLKGLLNRNLLKLSHTGLYLRMQHHVYGRK